MCWTCVLVTHFGTIWSRSCSVGAILGGSWVALTKVVQESLLAVLDVHIRTLPVTHHAVVVCA
jgi:hypothetical protein